jgi:acetyl-CoA acetyltransferase
VAAVVGVGESTFYARGASAPRTLLDLALNAITAALDDAGLAPSDVDGFTQYAHPQGLEPAVFAEVLGVPEVRFASTVSGGGGGSCGAIGEAAMAIATGVANVVVTVTATQVRRARPMAGSAYFADASEWAGSWFDFMNLPGLISPGHMFAVIAQRHMHLFGTTREHFAAVAMTTRAHASALPSSVMRAPLGLDDYLASEMISSPMCLFDFCLQSDGAAACVTVGRDRARDLAQRPAYVRGFAIGGSGRWGQGQEALAMSDELFASSGYGSLADELYTSAGIGPDDVDVALLYDHFTPMVLMQLEDLGFCPRGEGGPFVTSGATSWPGGSVPVNTHGGNLSNANLYGMTHINEAVRQVRGGAVNQVEDSEVALVTGGPGKLPMSGLVLRR